MSWSSVKETFPLLTLILLAFAPVPISSSSTLIRFKLLVWLSLTSRFPLVSLDTLVSPKYIVDPDRYKSFQRCVAEPKSYTSFAEGTKSPDAVIAPELDVNGLFGISLNEPLSIPVGIFCKAV